MDIVILATIFHGIISFEFVDVGEDVFNDLAGFVAIEDKRATGLFNLGQDEKKLRNVSIMAGTGSGCWFDEIELLCGLTILGARRSKARMPAFVLGLTILVDGALLPFPDMMFAFKTFASICEIYRGR